MKIWTIYHMQTKLQQQLNDDELRSFVSTLPLTEIPLIFVWQEGWKDWHPIAQETELMALRLPAAPPPLPAEALAPVSELDRMNFGFDTPRSSIAVVEVAPKVDHKSGFLDRRRGSRYDARLKIVMIAGSVSFRTFSLDVSVHGLRLEHPLPVLFLGQALDCYISRTDLKVTLKFSARLVSTPGDLSKPIRLEFLNAINQDQQTLENWIRELSVSHRIAG